MKLIIEIIIDTMSKIYILFMDWNISKGLWNPMDINNSHLIGQFYKIALG